MLAPKACLPDPCWSYRDEDKILKYVWFIYTLLIKIKIAISQFSIKIFFKENEKRYLCFQFKHPGDPRRAAGAGEGGPSLQDGQDHQV